MGLLSDALQTLRDASPRPPADGTRAHRVSIVIGNQQIDGWLDYEIPISMLEPANAIQMRRPFDLAAWRLCRPDQAIKVAIDGTVVFDGFIDDRSRDAREGTMQITARDKAGRLVQESIPSVAGWDGLMLDEAVRALVSPWYKGVALSNARNRAVARGKGAKAAASGEPAFFRIKGKFDESHPGRIDIGEMRWTVVEQLVASVGLIAMPSADGREIILCQPNYSQAVQYLFRHARSGSTVKNMYTSESVRDAYAMIEIHGSGGGDDVNYGEDVTTYVGVAKDGPNLDGTGKNFLHPKRLVMAQRAQQSNAEAKSAAELEMKRRSFRLRQLTVEAPLHGQLVAGRIPTLFAVDTLARCIDEDAEMDEIWYVYACTFRGSSEGETTMLNLVPRGTEFVT